MSCEFSEKTRELWFWQRECLICGRNQSLELHHILGRVSSSPLNSILICRLNCHSQGTITSRETRIKYLFKTYSFLMAQGYPVRRNDPRTSEEDKDFMSYARKTLNDSIYDKGTIYS